MLGLVRTFTVLLAAALAAVRVEPQSSGVTARLRGVSAVSSSVAWASGAGGTILRTVGGGRTWQPRPIPATERADFRDVDAFTDRVAYVLSIGSGESSRIYKTVDGGEHWDLQFANTDPRVFLDAMTFADEMHGVAFSDSVDGAFVVLTTSDGRTWTRIPADRLPPALPGEGAFAASGSNIAMIGRDRIWIGTTASRVLRSVDGGRRWTVIETPLATGAATRHFLHRVPRSRSRHRGRRQLSEGAGRGRQRRDHQRRGPDMDTREGAWRISIGGRLAAGTREDAHRRWSERNGSVT